MSVPREVLEELRAATVAGNLARCRLALGRVIEAHGGETDGKMKTHKATRAEGFRLDGDRVRYEIERHPGLGNWLRHPRQVRYVELGTGREIQGASFYAEIAPENLAEWATATVARTKATSAVYSLAATNAIASASDRAQVNERDWSLREVALLWVAIIAEAHVITDVWEGTVTHMHEALVESNGGNDFGDEDAREIVRIAKELWSALPRPKVRRPAKR